MLPLTTRSAGCSVNLLIYRWSGEVTGSPKPPKRSLVAILTDVASRMTASVAQMSHTQRTGNRAGLEGRKVLDGMGIDGSLGKPWEVWEGALWGVATLLWAAAVMGRPAY